MKKFNYLDQLEAESIYIIREVVANFTNPVMLYSIGKDSSVLLHLALKAFAPGKIPFPILHVDTNWKFKEMIEFRDKIALDPKIDLLVFKNEDGIKKNINPIDHGSNTHTDIMKTQALKQALNKFQFDAAIGGARRDEEKSRAKERVFSFRDENHMWDPKVQRPELWSLYNSKIKKNQSVRVFPLSNWTEIDIWLYIHINKIELVPLYFSKVRPIISRGKDIIMVDDNRLKVQDNEQIKYKSIRFRTLGCYPLTSPIFSDADSIEKIILELLSNNKSERSGRLIDNDQIGSMEKKKSEGYF